MTKAMKIKYLDNSSERRIDTTHWKPRSLIVLEDGTSLISSNDAKLEKENCKGSPDHILHTFVFNNKIDKWVNAEIATPLVKEIKDYSFNEQQNCSYCHFPFNAILDTHSNGYTQKIWEKRLFCFREEGSDRNYSAVTIDFKYCPMCGRQLTFEAHNYNIGLADD